MLMVCSRCNDRSVESVMDKNGDFQSTLHESPIPWDSASSLIAASDAPHGSEKIQVDIEGNKVR